MVVLDGAKSFRVLATLLRERGWNQGRTQGGTKVELKVHIYFVSCLLCFGFAAAVSGGVVFVVCAL